MYNLQLNFENGHLIGFGTVCNSNLMLHISSNIISSLITFDIA